MFIRNKNQAQYRRRGGLTSYWLLNYGDNDENQLMSTWVTVEPGGHQAIHHHEPPQIYVIIDGEGLMTVGEEQQTVRTGDLVYIPPNVPHGIQNTGDTVLQYISAATPALDIQQYYDKGQLKAQAYEE